MSILTYGITPPKAKNTKDKIVEIASRQIERLKELEIDALIVYDIQDESERISDERPYTFLPTLDPLQYSQKFLNDLPVPKILFRCVGNYAKETLEREFLSAYPGQHYVFVGPSSRKQQVNITLPEAYQMAAENNTYLNLGGIMIPERHQVKMDEHLRVIEKVNNGCNFFISQAVYDAEASKNFLSDYYYLCKSNGVEMKPIIFTLTLCGSPKTLEFLKWLGVSFPRWVENDLLNSSEILQKSFEISMNIFRELYAFASEKEIPIGFNIESVAIRKDEIEASIDLLNEVKKEFKSKGIASIGLSVTVEQ
jgi:hypothetical protein